jgi:hypothetical protein
MGDAGGLSCSALKAPWERSLLAPRWFDFGDKSADFLGDVVAHAAHQV